MNEKGITVLSLFDGMSCGQIALREAGIKVNKYFASEIDKHAIKQTLHNFPETVQLGCVTGVHAADLPHIDLLIGGSPCQGFSFAGKQLNFNDPRSVLFFEYVRILREIQEYNPGVLFLLENVRMRRECEQVITEQLGLEPVVINSALVSAQNRVRLYWTNIRTREEANLFDTKVFTDIPQPADRGIFIRDILEENVPKSYHYSEERKRKLLGHSKRQKEMGNNFGFNPRRPDEKSTTLRVSGRGLDTGVIVPGPRCVAVRGRFNPETGRNEQTAELREDGKTNCLTSVEKDNLLLESVCLTTRRTEYGKAIRRQYEAGEIQESRHNMTELVPRTDGKSNTLTTVQKDNLILQLPHGYNAGAVFRDKAPTVTSSRYEANNLVLTREVVQLNPGTESGGRQPYQQNRVYSIDGLSPALCSAHAGQSPTILTADEILRCFTPTECSRLQTIPDWYEWKCSKTQIYQMLGNGWTVEVIKHIFQFINTEKL
ncbi:MAG: DNA cytosine methyltransferase [Bacteroidales bacterium]|nr:DNA cytosine methyltransferase [Bacteroidales bacterium]